MDQPPKAHLRTDKDLQQEKHAASRVTIIGMVLMQSLV